MIVRTMISIIPEDVKTAMIYVNLVAELGSKLPRLYIPNTIDVTRSTLKNERSY